MYRFNLLNNLCKYVKKILSLFILKRPSYNGGGGGGGGGERGVYVPRLNFKYGRFM